MVVNGELKSVSEMDLSLAGTGNISFFPNPVSDGVLKVGGLAENATVTVYSLTGVKIKEQKATSCLLHLNTNGFSGPVFIAVQQNNNISWHKVIVE
ncbi:MAG: T9SS type A sorting domain-containing protein [Bacteroidales bacterium]|nr:T9SS type A sorting domain-containing protein [Bacteroidales bacterium]